MKLGPNQTALTQALRSGKYKQSTSCLRKGGTFCCLGVACDLSGLDEWVLNDSGYQSYCGKVSDLPEKVQKHFKMKDNLGEFEKPVPYRDVDYNCLAELNDAGVSFAEIADFIEQRANELFEAPA